MIHPRLREYVKDARWQALRGALVGTWMVHPCANVVRLRRYLGRSIRNPDSPRFVRVYNYITGTAFRTGRIKHPELTRLHKELRRRWNERQA
jgi:hypothetical protein